MRVYKFLPAEYALSALALRRLKVSLIQDLNDPFDLRSISTDRQPTVRKALESWRKIMAKKYALMSFSRHWRNPVLWSHYAQDHTGIALGFDLSEKLGGKVRYRAKRLTFPIARSRGPTALDSHRLLYTKFSHWRYEQEVRAWVRLDKKTTESGRYFFNFSGDLVLREVIIGSQCTCSIDAIRTLLDHLYPGAFLQKARLAHRDFAVVEDRDHRIQTRRTLSSYR